MDKKKVFGERLKQARQDNKWTKQAMAQMVGVSDVAIGYFEHGKRWPPMTTLVALADALECSLDWLCGLADEPERKSPSCDLSKSPSQATKRTFFLQFGSRLRSAREAAGMTQQTLARQLGIDTSAIGRYEIGDNAPTLERVTAIARIVGVDLCVLVGLDDNMHAHTSHEGETNP